MVRICENQTRKPDVLKSLWDKKVNIFLIHWRSIKNYCYYAKCVMWHYYIYWWFCTTQSISELTNWPKRRACVHVTDVTVHAPAVAINLVNGNQEKDLAAWHCKSFIDRLALIRAAIVKGFSYWCLSTLALKALTSGVKVRSVAGSLQNSTTTMRENPPLLVWSLHVHAALALLPLLVLWGKKKKRNFAWLPGITALQVG